MKPCLAQSVFTRQKDYGLRALDSCTSAGGSTREIPLERRLVRLEGFEPPTCCSGGNRSIHLSYRRTLKSLLPSHFDGQGGLASGNLAIVCRRGARRAGLRRTPLVYCEGRREKACRAVRRVAGDAQTNPAHRIARRGRVNPQRPGGLPPCLARRARHGRGRGVHRLRGLSRRRNARGKIRLRHRACPARLHFALRDHVSRFLCRLPQLPFFDCHLFVGQIEVRETPDPGRPPRGNSRHGYRVSRTAGNRHSRSRPASRGALAP
jgi:hypothetical protein